MHVLHAVSRRLKAGLVAEFSLNSRWSRIASITLTADISSSSLKKSGLRVRTCARLHTRTRLVVKGSVFYLCRPGRHDPGGHARRIERAHTWRGLALSQRDHITRTHNQLERPLLLKQEVGEKLVYSPCGGV